MFTNNAKIWYFSDIFILKSSNLVQFQHICHYGGGGGKLEGKKILGGGANTPSKLFHLGDFKENVIGYGNHSY